MKFLAGNLLLSCIVFVSCQKSIKEPSFNNTLNNLPKQVIIKEANLSSDNATHVTSIKYSADNSKVELFADDTTNTNPYDALLSSSAYNSNGYLISHNIFESGAMLQAYSIQRSADAKILFIAHKDNVNEETDTSRFTYQNVTGGTKITTIFSSYYQGDLVYVDTFFYDYNNDWKLTNVQINNTPVITTYAYNGNKSLSKIGYNSDFFSNQSNFSYTSGLADAQEDVLLKKILGKDYYLQNIKQLYPFNLYSDNQYLTLSATDPYHVSTMQNIIEDNGSTSIDEYSWTYTLDNRKLLSTITSSYNGEAMSTTTFKY